MTEPIKIYFINQDESMITHLHNQQNLFCNIINPTNDSSLFTYSLNQIKNYLFYRVTTAISHNYDQNLKAGQFKADLWKQDVIELFISDNSNIHNSKSNYQEFNFSPTGAYWTARFAGYRNKISQSESPINAIEILKTCSEKQIEFIFKIPHSSLINNGEFSENCRINCSVIWGQNQKTYYSTSNLKPDKPDFHDINSWVRVSVFDARNA